MNDIDLTIIGAGIAGVTCAIYAKRAGLEFYFFDSKPVGGQLFLMDRVDNYPGVKLGTQGMALAQTLSETLSELGIEIITKQITKIEKNSQGLNVFLEDSLFSTKGMVIATGASFKQLGVQGEDQFLGKGVSYCAVCDGFFFKNKIAAVVGGGNSAAEEALYLSNIARKVILIHRRDKLRAVDYLQNELMRKNNVEIVYNSVVKEIQGSERVEGIVIESHDRQRQTLKADGVFIAIGVAPATEFVRDIVKVDGGGFIISDEELKTSCDRIWAAGDCRKRPLRQLITAAAEGAVAAMSAYKRLKGTYISS